jgi:hypothetical protein
MAHVPLFQPSNAVLTIVLAGAVVAKAKIVIAKQLRLKILLGLSDLTSMEPSSVALKKISSAPSR